MSVHACLYFYTLLSTQIILHLPFSCVHLEILPLPSSPWSSKNLKSIFSRCISSRRAVLLSWSMAQTTTCRHIQVYHYRYMHCHVLTCKTVYLRHGQIKHIKSTCTWYDIYWKWLEMIWLSESTGVSLHNTYWYPLVPWSNQQSKQELEQIQGLTCFKILKLQ